jgi:hypothetical protein
MCRKSRVRGTRDERMAQMWDGEGNIERLAACATVQHSTTTQSTAAQPGSWLEQHHPTKTAPPATTAATPANTIATPQLLQSPSPWQCGAQGVQVHIPVRDAQGSEAGPNRTQGPTQDGELTGRDLHQL